MDDIFDQEAVPNFCLMHFKQAFPWKIIIRLQHRLNLRSTEHATAAACRIAETGCRVLSGRARPMKGFCPDMPKRIEERGSLC